MSDKEYVVKMVREAHKCIEKALDAHRCMHKSPYGKGGFQQNIGEKQRDSKIANEEKSLDSIMVMLGKLIPALEGE